VTRRAFFFPHPLEPTQKRGEINLPGRVPYQVTGQLLGPTDSGAPFWVMADGFYDPLSGEIPAVVGANQDPCVFSAPWGPFHSFYRIDGVNAGNEKVAGDKVHVADSLPEAVSPGDVIIYGKTTPLNGKNIKEVWVDTVIVVDEVIELPVDAAEKAPYAFSGSAAFPEGLPKKGTDAFRFNLSDAEPGAGHPTTNRSPHRIIRGRISDDSDAVDKLETSFVPLADRTGGSCRVCAIDKGHLGNDWAPLLAFFEQRVFGRIGAAPKGGWIAEFPTFALAESLLRAVVKRSGGHQGMRGTVAIPPLTPASGMKRWEPKTSRLING